MRQLSLAFIVTWLLLGCGGAEKKAAAPSPPEERPSPDAEESPIPSSGNDVPNPLELREDQPRIEGGLDPGEVTYRLRSKFGEMTACLEETLGPEFKGKRYQFTLSFEISSLGQVSALALETAVDEIKRCNAVFMEVVAKINFGPSEDGSPTKVVYPLEVTRNAL
jgi:hypothetical protein